MHSVGELLRQWRRHRAISQLDLAIAADVSPRHVSLVETGRSNPSADMVVRLATHLDVPLRDQNRLLLAAGHAPRYTESPLDDEELAAARDAVRRVLAAHEPYPAYVLDRRWNIVQVNRGAELFMDEVRPELLQLPVNLVRLALDPHGLAQHVDDVSEVRAVLRTRIGRQLATAPDPWLAALYDELLGPHPDDPTGEPVSVSGVRPMTVRVGGRTLRLFSTVMTFGAPLDVTLDELFVESFYPADAESAAQLAE